MRIDHFEWKLATVQNLREKLIKAGLVTAEQVRESSKPAVSPAAPSSPAPGSRAFQRRESLRQLALDRTVREWVQASQVPLERGERAFFFMTRKGKLRRWELSERQAQLLELGKLAIVERPEPAGIEHSLVPAETAEKIVAVSARSVRFYNRKGSPIGFGTDAPAGE